MGTYSSDFDDEAVEHRAYDICLADGNEDPERMTYVNHDGIPEPYGPVWSLYINEAVHALQIAAKADAI